MTDTVLVNCIKALESIDGCEVYSTTMNGSWFVTWDGGSGLFSAAQFHRICHDTWETSQ